MNILQLARLTPNEWSMLSFYFDLEAQNSPVTAFSHEELALTLSISKRSACSARKKLLNLGFLVQIGVARDHTPIMRFEDVAQNTATRVLKNKAQTLRQLGLNFSIQKAKPVKKERKVSNVINVANGKVIGEAPKDKKTPVISHAFDEAGISELPQDWREYALANAPNKDPEAIFSYFKNYWHVRAQELSDRTARKKNWKLAWQLWCLREGSRTKITQKAPVGPKNGSGSLIKRVNGNDYSAGWSS